MSKSDHRAIQTLHGRLQERFPLAFPKHYDDLRPLKLGILTDLITQLPDVDPTAMRRALANHTSRDGYLLALIHGRGNRRYDLDGQPAGTVTLEERTEAQKRLDASTKRGQDRAERVRTHKEREEKRRQQREIERKNREAKAARKAEHERVQQEIAARKAALIAQGITPESRSERKRRLAREAAERAARRHQEPKSGADRPMNQGFAKPTPRPPRDATGQDQHPEWLMERAEPTPNRPMPQVAFKKKRRVVPPSGDKK